MKEKKNHRFEFVFGDEKLGKKIGVNYYWVGQKVCMFFSHKIKDMFFISNNNFTHLDILSVSAISHVV